MESKIIIFSFMLNYRTHNLGIMNGYTKKMKIMTSYSIYAIFNYSAHSGFTGSTEAYS